MLYLKFSNPDAAFTHTLNELRYYINCGIVVIICSAIFLVAPKQKITLVAFFATVLLQFIIKYIFPEMNYFVRAMWVILISFSLILFMSKTKFINFKSLIISSSSNVKMFGTGMVISLILNLHKQFFYF